MNEDLVTLVTEARFTPVVREGYVMADVDGFLEQLADRLAVGAPVRELIEATRLPIASWKETYARYEVDLLLSQVKHKALTRDVEPEDKLAPTPAAELHVPQPRAETVVEKKEKGLLARIFTAH